MLNTFTRVAIILVVASWLAARAASAQTPVKTATAVAEPSASVSPAPSATAAAEPSVAAFPAASETPEPTPTGIPFPTPGANVLSTDSSLSGSLVQDTDADGAVGNSDSGVVTLVEIRSFSGQGLPGYSLLTDHGGAFSFNGLPAGEYVLFVWWGPGFIGVPTTPTNDGLYWTGISVSPDGTVRGELPRPLLVKPNTTGGLGYPVRTGGGDLPVGTLQIGAAPAAPRALPRAGSGETDTWWPVLAGAAALLLGAAGTTALALRRRSG